MVDDDTSSSIKLSTRSVQDIGLFISVVQQKIHWMLHNNRTVNSSDSFYYKLIFYLLWFDVVTIACSNQMKILLAQVIVP